MEYSKGFLEFWSTWPKSQRKVGKGKCYEKWVKDKLESISEHIVAVVTVMKKTRQWQDQKYIPAPIVFLNQGRYDCEIDDIKTATTGSYGNATNQSGRTFGESSIQS